MNHVILNIKLQLFIVFKYICQQKKKTEIVYEFNCQTMNLAFVLIVEDHVRVQDIV